MSLLALQQDFRRHLLDRSGAIGAWVAAPAPGLAIYHNAYRAQLIECLGESYERTHQWLGGEAFLAAMRDHIEAHPPHGWTLGDYGADFAATLGRRYPDDPEVAELAGLEWRLSRAFESADVPALPVTEIATIDWDRAAIEFVPSLWLVPATTNAGAIWSALAAAEAPPAARMLAEPRTHLVWRQDFTPCFRELDPAEHDAIVLIRAGGSFAGLCATLVAARGEAAGLTAAGQMLARWFADGLIAIVTTKETPCA